MDASTSDWPYSTIPNTRVWALRCKQRLLEIDPTLAIDVVEALAEDMAQGAHYRALLPEAAVDCLVMPVVPHKAW